ncbi:T9SS type A sorting domain-containing protein [candidate division KSB1 bacterium]|nr:T9SS type A sorting domain-containing protein [candidate division KSB1 bacterium]
MDNSLVIANIPCGYDVNGITISNNFQKVFVCYVEYGAYGGGVHTIDTQINEIIYTTTVGSNSSKIRINPQNTVLSVSASHAKGITLIDAITYKVITQIPIGGSPGESLFVPKRIEKIIVDIKPGSCPNPLNIKSKGVLPLAVLGKIDFNVYEIDFSTIKLEGVAPIRSSIDDVGTPAISPDDCNPDDPDGFNDLCLKFDTQEIVSAIGLVEDGQEVTLTLTGNLNDGTPIEGKDKVQIIAKGKKLPKQLAEVIGNEAKLGNFSLFQNYPNPFNPETQISYQIPDDNFVSLRIFNSLGQEIRTLVNVNQQAGNFSVMWDGRDDFGELVGSGFYFYVLKAGEFRGTKKALLLR